MVKNQLAKAGDICVQSLDPEDTWRRKWQLTPVCSPEKSHGQRSLAGYSPWGRKSRT